MAERINGHPTVNNYTTPTFGTGYKCERVHYLGSVVINWKQARSISLDS